MVDKLSFTIENAEMIQENPESNFAVVGLDFFASGDNLHNMYVSEETLMKTADTIKNCPLVWKYNEVLDDSYTHDPDEVPCGFVPETTTITPKKLEDGRTMLSTIAYVWKRYTGPLLSFFKRDGGKKPVSVEMSVYKTKEIEDGKTELLDFRYEGVTVLGSFVTPAIPLANANILSFSELKDEYEKDFEIEFSTDKFIIPVSARRNAEKGLETRKTQEGGTSTAIAFARYLVNNKTMPRNKVLEMNNYFSSHNSYKTPTNKNYTGGDIDWILWGGDSGKEWAERILGKMSEIVTFPYKSIGDINPALKGIEPPITLAQANAIAKQADSIGSDEKKNGWAIAISSFRDTHHVEDGKWVKNEGSTVKASENSEMEEMAAEETNNKEMAMEEKDKVVNMAEVEIEVEEEKKEEETKEEMAAEPKEEEKKFEFPLEKMSEFFADEEDKAAKDEFCKGEMADFGVVMNALYAKMCRMQEYAKKLENENKAYMAECEDLKKFRAEIENQQKEFAVNETLRDISASVILPDEVREDLRTEAEKYTLGNIEVWKNYCKAKSFDFAIKQPKNDGVIKIGLPFGGITKKENDLWAEK